MKITKEICPSSNTHLCPLFLFLSFELPVTLMVQSTKIPSHVTVVNSWVMLALGTSCLPIHPCFFWKLALWTVWKQKLLLLLMADGTLVKSRKVNHEVYLWMHIGEYIEMVVFNIANIGNDNMILRISWLRQYNPEVDWTQLILKFTLMYCQTHCLPGKNIRQANWAAYKEWRWRKEVEVKQKEEAEAWAEGEECINNGKVDKCIVPTVRGYLSTTQSRICCTGQEEGKVESIEGEEEQMGGRGMEIEIGGD